MDTTWGTSLSAPLGSPWGWDGLGGVPFRRRVGRTMGMAWRIDPSGAPGADVHPRQDFQTPSLAVGTGPVVLRSACTIESDGNGGKRHA